MLVGPVVGKKTCNNFLKKQPLQPSFALRYIRLHDAQAAVARGSRSTWVDPSADERYCLLHQNLSIPRSHSDVKLDPAVNVDLAYFGAGGGAA